VSRGRIRRQSWATVDRRQDGLQLPESVEGDGDVSLVVRTDKGILEGRRECELSEAKHQTRDVDNEQQISFAELVV
jgi:hypothetical protein